MQIRAGGCVAVLVAGVLPTACQGPAPSRAITTAPPIPQSEDHHSNRPPAAVDWAGAGDCLDQLKLLHARAEDGRLEAAPPFAVVLAEPASGLDWVHAQTVPVVADLSLDAYEDQASAAAAAPCLIVIEQPGEVRAAHRVVDVQVVASQYQSGVRSEKNPDYEAAQARLREAERETKKRGSSILRVGDPLLDLVGLLAGGIIAAFGQVGGDHDVDQALAELKETPRSRDRPIYRAYEFERSIVRAGKEAAVPVALRDLKEGRIWRTRLRQREMRQVAVLEGLDPRDRDYEQHRAGAMSWQEFEHWQQQPPKLPISALVVALIEDGGAGVEPPTGGSELTAEAVAGAGLADRAAVDQQLAGSDAASASPVVALAPGAGPDFDAGLGRPASDALDLRRSVVSDLPGAASGEVAPTVSAPALDPRVASVVRLKAGSRRGGGLYVEPRLVVTTAELVGATSVVDVTTSDGEVSLGLVVHTDPGRNLAVVHVPRAGRPAALLDQPAWQPGRAVDVLELIGEGQARLRRATVQQASPADDPAGMASPPLVLAFGAGNAAATGAPLFLDDQAIGLVGGRQIGRERDIVPIVALDQMLDPGTLAALP